MPRARSAARRRAMASQDSRNDATAPERGPADGLARGGDARFTTWRPGDAPPPVVAPPALAAQPGLAAGPPPPAPRPAATPAPAPRDDAPARAAPAPAVPEPAPLDEFFYRPDEVTPAIAADGVQAGPEPPADAQPDTASREEYLTFLLGGEEYAVGIALVREVLRSPPVTEVPRAPAHVLGVITVRGEVVAVVDPRRRLGIEEPPPTPGAGRLVIVDVGDGPCALLVDGIASVVRLRPGSIEARPQGLGTAASECLSGIGRDRDRLFTVLDVVALLRRGAPARREGRANAGA